MGAVTSQITSLTIVYSTVYSDADQRKHQSSSSLAFEREIHREPLNSPHNWSVTRKMFPFDDVITFTQIVSLNSIQRKECSLIFIHLATRLILGTRRLLISAADIPHFGNLWSACSSENLFPLE